MPALQAHGSDFDIRYKREKAGGRERKRREVDTHRERLACFAGRHFMLWFTSNMFPAGLVRRGVTGCGLE